MARSRTPPKQQRAVETRDALLSAAAVVFSRATYAEARLKDIAAESGISEGAIYFHFGNKQDIAVAVLDAQQERMTDVLTRGLAAPAGGLDRLLNVIRGLALLIADDAIVQAGIRLAGQPSAEYEPSARDPYFEWVRITRTLIRQGIEDGSIDENVEADSVADLLNSAFVGAQVLSGLADKWASLPERIATLEPLLRKVLAPDRQT